MKKLFLIAVLFLATGANAQVDISSLVPIAYQYNNACGLGISGDTINKLAALLSQFRSQGQVSDTDINKGTAIAMQKYRQDPSGFCVEAQKVAVVIKGMFPE